MFRALGPSPSMVYKVFRVLMLFPSLDSSVGLNSTKKGTLLFEQSRLLGLRLRIQGISDDDSCLSSRRLWGLPVYVRLYWAFGRCFEDAVHPTSSCIYTPTKIMKVYSGGLYLLGSCY